MTVCYLRKRRAAGQERDLLEEVWRRLSDAALLQHPDLQQSIEQMRQGRERVLRPFREDGAEGR